MIFLAFTFWHIACIGEGPCYGKKETIMTTKSLNLVLAALLGTALTVTVVAQTTVNPATGMSGTQSEADKARSDANTRSRIDSEIRANQVRREAEEAATRSRDNAGLGSSGTPAGSIGAGVGPSPGSAMGSGSGALDRTLPGTSGMGTGSGGRTGTGG
jgi:hypothetical protein